MKYEVTIQMSQSTINYLKSENYTLYGFKGIVSSDPDPDPSILYGLL
jgi:hypothetical protein